MYGLNVESNFRDAHLIGRTGRSLALDIFVSDDALEAPPRTVLHQTPVLREVILVQVLGRQVGTLGEHHIIVADNAVVGAVFQLAYIGAHGHELLTDLIEIEVRHFLYQPVAASIARIGPGVQCLAIAIEVKATITAEVTLGRDIDILLRACIVGTRLNKQCCLGRCRSAEIGLQIFSRVSVADRIAVAILQEHPHLSDLRCAACGS